MTRRCTANYEKCTKTAIEKEPWYCQACLDMEVHYYKRRISELKCEIDQCESALTNLGSPTKRYAETIHPGGRVERWSSKTGKRPPDLPPDQYPPNGLLCSVCRMPQYETNGGACCINGHGGVQGVEE